MRQLIKTAALGLTFGLAATGAFAASPGVVAECQLLEEAYQKVKSSGAKAHNDILMGCPGYENWPGSMSKRDNRKAFGAATKAGRPAQVKAAGKAGKILFQRMIARGVPVEIAQAMAATPQFARAVASFGQ